MKNLFKNLMLVAVAAMAFTACSQDVNEVNNVERVTRYEFTANIADDTRSGFAEKEDGAKAYKSEWFGDEELKLFVTDYQGYYVETTATVNTKGEFTLELTDAPESFFMSVVSPADSWASESSYTIPAEQTPLANSVDPKAHLLQCSPMPVSGGQASIDLTHSAAYGKMTVKGVGFEIDHVVVDLKGSLQGNARECSYTINADNVENNVFWFATEPMDVVAEFTVTAYDEEDNAVAKTVDVAAVAAVDPDKALAFGYGRVSTFSVSGLEEVEEVTYPVFTSGRWDNYPNMDKKIIINGEGSLEMVLNFSNCNYEYFIDPGVYTIEKSASGPGKIWGAYSDWCKYTDAEGTEYGMLGGTVTVSIVGGKYVFEFVDLQLTNAWEVAVGTLPYAKFEGVITNLQVPDNRTTLDIPSNVQATVSGKTITLKWDPVDNVDGYKVWMFSPDNEAITEIVEGTQYVFEAQKGNTQYHFNVYSYASDENPTYKTSTNWTYVTATTEDTDPKIVLSKETISFTADGGNDAVDVTLKNIDGDFTYTVDVDWLTVTRSGAASLAVSAPAYDNESEGRSATITITAGDLTKGIAVTQSKKPSASTGDGDTGDSDAINLVVLVKENYMPAKYTGYCNFCLVDAEGKNFIRVEVNDYPLLETTYVYSASYKGWDSGTFFGPGTYISLSGPNSAPGDYSTSVNPKDGGEMTVTKTGDNDNYHIVFDFELPDGTKYNAVFDGQINFI